MKNCHGDAASVTLDFFLSAFLKLWTLFQMKSEDTGHPAGTFVLSTSHPGVMFPWRTTYYLVLTLSCLNEGSY